MISFLLIFVGMIVGDMKSDNVKETVPAVALHLIFYLVLLMSLLNLWISIFYHKLCCTVSPRHWIKVFFNYNNNVTNSYFLCWTCSADLWLCHDIDVFRLVTLTSSFMSYSIRCCWWHWLVGGNVFRGRERCSYIICITSWLIYI